MICPWCGLGDDVMEFEVSADGRHAWCPDCDGHIFLDDVSTDTNRRRPRMVLFLESRDRFPSPVDTTNTALRKRLSPLRYPGGKSKVIDQIYTELSPERLDTFVELFAGGASLGLSLLDAGKIDHLVLNDLDPWVSNFWKVVCTHSDELIELIQGPAPTMKDYFEYRDKMQSSPGAWAAARYAYEFLVVNRLSFGGVSMANPICGKNATSERLLQRWNPNALTKRIERIATLSDRIAVTKMDAVELFDDDVAWRRNSTIFVDPPYTVAGKKLYRETFVDRHQELADTLNECFRCFPDPDIIITYDDCEMIRDLYPYAEVKTLRTCWSIQRAV